MPQRPLISIPITLLALISSIYCQQVPDQVIEIFRHGAKAVYSKFDPSWPANGDGDLTPVGMRQHYILGKALAEKYPYLLGSNYNYSQVFVLSDTTPRCIQSAQAQLYGMYLGSGPALNSTYPRDLAVPPYQDPIIQKIVNTLPNSAALPFNYVPTIVQIADTSDEYLFEVTPTSCPNEFIWYEENLKSAQFQERLQLFQPTLDNLNTYFNETLSFEDLSDIMNDIEADIAANKSMPGGIDNPELISNVTYAFAYVSVASFLGQESQRQIGGFGLINAVLEELADFRQGESFNNVAMYSGHDLNIWAVLAAFGVVSEECVLANFESSLTNATTPYPNCYYPPFASNIIVEFYNFTDAPFVKVYYNNVLLPLCNGQTDCSYEDFIFAANNAIGNSTVQEYFQKCGANVTAPSENEMMLNSKIEAPFSKIKNSITLERAIIVSLMILCGILVANNVCDKRRYEKNLNQLLNERVLYDEDNRIKLY